MRANHSLAGTKPRLVLHSNPGLSRLAFFWPPSLRSDRSEIYSLPVRVLISGGLSLALWIIIGLSVALAI
jgi:hypothetical protein